MTKAVRLVTLGYSTDCEPGLVPGSAILILRCNGEAISFATMTHDGQISPFRLAPPLWSPGNG